MSLGLWFPTLNLFHSFSFEFLFSDSHGAVVALHSSSHLTHFRKITSSIHQSFPFSQPYCAAASIPIIYQVNSSHRTSKVTFFLRFCLYPEIQSLTKFLQSSFCSVLYSVAPRGKLKMNFEVIKTRMNIGRTHGLIKTVLENRLSHSVINSTIKKDKDGI